MPVRTWRIYSPGAKRIWVDEHEVGLATCLDGAELVGDAPELRRNAGQSRHVIGDIAQGAALGDLKAPQVGVVLATLVGVLNIAFSPIA